MAEKKTKKGTAIKKPLEKKVAKKPVKPVNKKGKKAPKNTLETTSLEELEPEPIEEIPKISKTLKKNDKKSYKFSLIGVNIEKVDKKYSIGQVSSINLDEENVPENTTKIDDLELRKKTVEVFSFLDESKRLRKCAVSMIDFSTKTELKNKKYKCFWDKNFIPDHFCPLGCPIKYVPDRAIKTYHSEISKDDYVISEPITEKRLEELKQRNDNRFAFEQNGYYETDGIFCSFNCILAFLEAPENKNNTFYKNSETLLLKLYKDFNDEEIKTDSLKELISAPHWRTLIEFGGHLNIDQFRETFNKVHYIEHGMITFKSIGRIYEDRIKL